MGLLSNITAKKEAEIKVEQIEIAKIIADPKQPRREFTGIEELAATIKKHGLQNPIHVQKEGDKYVIISGERRYRAFKEYTDFRVIPCFIHTEKDPATIRFLQLIENLQRADLNPVEEAHAYKSLLDTKAVSQKELAAEIGVSETAISRTVRLASLPQAIQDQIQSVPGLPKSLLIEIASELDEERQLELWEQVKTGKIQKREQLRQERKGLKRKDLLEMDADTIWELIKKAVRKDKEIIKKLINAAQIERLMKAGDEQEEVGGGEEK